MVSPQYRDRHQMIAACAGSDYEAQLRHVSKARDAGLIPPSGL